MSAVRSPRRRLILTALIVAAAASAGIGTLRGQTPPRKRLLFLTHAALYKHSSLAPAEAAVTEYGKTGGFDVTTLEGYKQESARLDLSFLTPEYLAQFDGLMLMTNGNLPLTDAQKRAIVDYVRNGKALIGVHCASLTLYDYPEFGEVLGGYYRRSIVPTNMVGQKIGVLKVEDPSHPATRMMGWQLAGRRGVLSVRHGGVGREQADRADQPGGAAAHPDGVLTRSRARAAQPRHGQDRHQRSRAGGREGRRLPAGLVAHVRQRADRSTRRSATATTSGPRTPSSARTSPAASAGRSGSRTDRSTRAKIIFVSLILLFRTPMSSVCLLEKQSRPFAFDSQEIKRFHIEETISSRDVGG